MATITAAVGGGNWTTDATWVGGVKPTAADDVLLTAASGAVAVTAGSVCKSLDMTGYISTLSGSGDLSIGNASGGACTLGGTISGTWTTAFVSTSNNGGTGWSVTSSSKTWPGAVSFNGSGGKWVLQDNMTVTGAITVALGGFFGNGKTIVATAFSSAASASRTTDLTNCTLTVSVGSAWTTSPTGTNTFTGSTITQSSTGTFAAGAGVAYSTVILTGPTPTITGAGATFINFTRTGTAAKTASLSFSADITVTGTLTLTGNTVQGINRLLLVGTTRGTQQTITATGAAVVITGDVDFMDIAISGSPSWTNASSCFVGDCGGNGTLITTNRTTPATQTSTGTASFSWSTHGWTSRVPLPQDNVSIPNAFIASRVVTVDMPRLGATITMTCTGSPSLTNAMNHESYGSVTLAAGITTSGTFPWTIAGRGIYTFTSAGVTFLQAISFNAPGGTYTLQDTLTTSRTLGSAVSVINGTLVDGGNIVAFTGVTGGGFTITGGTLTKTGAWTTATTGAVAIWNVTGGTVTDTGSYTITAASANIRTFVGGGQTYGTLIYTVAGSTGGLTITGNNTFIAWTFSDASNTRTITLTGTTQTIATAAGLTGIIGNSSFKTAITGGTILSNLGTVSVDYVQLTSQTASGNSLFYAGANSTNSGGNSGWVFTAPPLGGGSMLLMGL